MMDIRPIRTETDLTWALAEIEPYFDSQPEPGTADADRFDVLATLIAAYEARRHDVPTGDAGSVLRFAISDLGRSEDEVADIMDSRDHAAEVLDGRREPTAEQIVEISSAWHLPVEALMPKPSPARAA